MPAASIRCRYCRAELIAVKPAKTSVLESILADEPTSSSGVVHRPRLRPSGRWIRRDSRRANDAAEILADPADGDVPARPRAGANGFGATRLGQWIGMWGTRVVAVLLLAPFSVSGPVPGQAARISFGVPMIHSGDEPHHLVLIESAIQDFDFDVANNYASVHRGGLGAGRKFAGSPLDHHVTWFVHGQRFDWGQAYETEPSRWDHDAAGHPQPTLLKNAPPLPASERSRHSPGLAVLTSPLLWPFRGTRWVEPLALLMTAVATVCGLMAFVELIRPLSRVPWVWTLAAAVAYLGSPLWAYARTLYPEPFLAALGVLAYAQALRSQRPLAAGMLLGAGAMLNVAFALVAVPLVVDASVRERWAEARRIAIPVLATVALVLWWNHASFGAWLAFSQTWSFRSVAEGLPGLAASPRHGLLAVSPVLALAALGIPSWFRQHRREAVLMTAAAVLFVVAAAGVEPWWGGSSYSARRIVPVMPFLFLPLVVVLDRCATESRPFLSTATAVLAFVSIQFGAIAAFGCENVVGRHPLEFVLDAGASR